jgi:hypothetical protein
VGPVTALVGYASPTAIQIGDRVAVYGLLKTDSLGVTSLQATLIAQKTSGTGVRLTGYITQYNTAAGTFVIGNQTVTVGSATLNPAGTSLSNGQLVTVWSNAPPIGTAISANTIRIKGPTGTSGTLTLSGPISGYLSTASFKIRNTAVDAANATILPSGTTLSDNKYVVAVGKYDAATNKLTATSVAIYAPAASTAVELHGTILNLVSPSSFTVRGAVVDASSAAVSGGTLAQLSNGVFVNVFGAITNNQVKATTIQIVSLNPLNAPSGAMLDLMGTITSYDSTNGRYTMTTSSGTVLNGTTTPSMFYTNGTATNLTVGQAVNVRGTMSNNALSTSVMSFTQMPAMPAAGMTYLEGTASNVTSTSFELNGMTIQRNGVPIQGGGNGMMGSNGMMGGSRLNVAVQFTNGQYVATAITMMGG